MQSSNVNLYPNRHFSIRNERGIEYFSTIHMCSEYESIQYFVVVVFWTNNFVSLISNFCWNFISLVFYLRSLMYYDFEWSIVWFISIVCVIFFFRLETMYFIYFYSFLLIMHKKDRKVFLVHEMLTFICYRLCGFIFTDLFNDPKILNSKASKNIAYSIITILWTVAFLLNKKLESLILTLNLKWLNSLDNILLLLLYFFISNSIN